MAAPPREVDLLWPDPECGPWWVKVWWRVQHGVPTPVGFALKSWVEGEDERRRPGPHNALPVENEDVVLPRVDARLLRQLPIGALLSETRDKLTEQLRHDVDTSRYPQEWLDSLDRWRVSVQPEVAALETRGRGRDLGDDHYREVAEVYASAVQEGRPPTAAVAERWTVSKSAAAKKVARARARGFLPPTTRGRVGTLTEEV